MPFGAELFGDAGLAGIEQTVSPQQRQPAAAVAGPGLARRLRAVAGRPQGGCAGRPCTLADWLGTAATVRDEGGEHFSPRMQRRRR